MLGALLPEPLVFLARRGLKEIQATRFLDHVTFTTPSDQAQRGSDTYQSFPPLPIYCFHWTTGRTLCTVNRRWDAITDKI